LRTHEHVDRIDLERVQPMGDAPDVGDSPPPSQARRCQSLRAEREPSRFVGRE
jgi:hypothetical protein